MTDRALVIESVGRAAVRPVSGTDGTVLVRTLYSGVSAGTELTFLNGTNPALHSSFDPELGLFRPGRPAADYPVTRLGYMEVARVEATADDGTGPPVGSLVAMAYGHRTGYRADPLRDRIVELPAELDPLLGIYVAHMGPICANGLLHAAVEACGTDVRSLGDGVRGLRVAVVGGGVIGLLTALFATYHGAAEVVVLDPTPQRRAAAEQLGLRTLDPDDGDPAVILKSRWRHTAGDRGADVVFQCRGRTTSLALALRLLRPQGTVIDLATTAPRWSSARSSTTTAWPSAAPRSGACPAAPGTPGTGNAFPRKRSPCWVGTATRSASTSSRTSSRSTTVRRCSPSWPAAAGTSSRPCSRRDRRAPTHLGPCATSSNTSAARASTTAALTLHYRRDAPVTNATRRESRRRSFGCEGAVYLDGRAASCAQSTLRYRGIEALPCHTVTASCRPVVPAGRPPSRFIRCRRHRCGSLRRCGMVAVPAPDCTRLPTWLRWPYFSTAGW